MTTDLHPFLLRFGVTLQSSGERAGDEDAEHSTDRGGDDARKERATRKTAVGGETTDDD